MSLQIGAGLIGVGEPSLGRYANGGGWDFGPWFLAIVALIVLRVFLDIQIRWYVALLAILLAPAAIAFAGWVGPWISFTTAATGLVVARSILARRGRMGTV
jgi:hypothetical protein